MKKIKNIEPSAIFQLVIIVLLFSYRGCSPGNISLEDMSVGRATESVYTFAIRSLANAESGNRSSAKNFSPGNQLAALPVVNGFFKQFVTLKSDE